MIVLATVLAELQRAIPEALWTSDENALPNATAYHGNGETWRFLVVEHAHGADGTATAASLGTVIRLTPELAAEALAFAKKNPLDMRRK